jgi:hypothetical protein
MAEMFNPLNPEILELSRQRRMADLLTTQGLQTPQGQTVAGGIYVPPNPMEYIAKLYGTYQGTKANRELDTKEVALAKALRDQEVQDITRFSELQYGGKQIPAQAQAGPMPDGGNIPIGTTLSEPDPMAAFQLAAQSRSPIIRSQLAEMLKGQKLGEGEVIQRYNPATGKMETTGQGNAKYRAPIQIDTGTSIELRDPLDPTKVISRIGKSQMPTAGQVVEREDGTFLVDTRTGQARPIVGPSGQPLMSGGKPLTEAQGNSVAFGARAIEANRIATELEKQGVRNTGAIRTAVGGLAGMTPFVGEQLEQGVRSTFNVLPSVAGGPSSEQQQVEQARRNFVSAVLRKESGAAIGVDEYKNEERKYFPQAGDSDAVIKQKQEARKLAIEALKAQAGPSGVRQINQIANQQLQPQDQEALNWANSNPNDPRSAQIKQRLGR